MPERHAARPRLRRALGAIALALVVLEAASFAGVAVLRWAKPDVFYRPGHVTPDAYARYLADRDPVLGWPPPKRFAERPAYFDASGSRIVPAFPDPASSAHVSLYGDSMTESLEVDHADAWGNRLAERIGLRVANFGVAGYGTDQAYLRFVHNERDTAPVVLLNHFTDDIRRNVNQWRYLLSTSPGEQLGFKPRFVVRGGELELVPLPTLAYDELQAAFTDPARHLPHEFYLPDDGVSGVQTARFPYALTLLRAHDNMILAPKLAREPRHVGHYRADHPSDALEVTRLVLRAFVAEAVRRGRTPVVTVIPDGKDLEHFQAHGTWPYRPLVEALVEDGIEPLDFGPGIVARLGGRSPCAVINRCYDHFNAEGYAILADLAYEHLARRGLLPAARDGSRARPGSRVRSSRRSRSPSRSSCRRRASGRRGSATTSSAAHRSWSTASRRSATAP